MQDRIDEAKEPFTGVNISDIGKTLKKIQCKRHSRRNAKFINKSPIQSKVSSSTWGVPEIRGKGNRMFAIAARLMIIHIKYAWNMLI